MSNAIIEYNQQIQDGTVTVGRFVRLFYGIVTEGLSSGSYFFDAEKASHAIDWIEKNCRHTEGPLAPQLINLELWEKAIISVIYGLKDKNGNRYFKEIVVVMARKNGKSLLASCIIRYEWFNGDEYGTRIFLLAPKLDQTDIIYSSVWNMTLLDPKYQEQKEAVKAGIKYHERKTVDDSDLPKHRMTDLYISSRNSMVKKIAMNAKKADGFNPSMGVCDEIASWAGEQGRRQYEVIRSGMGARPDAFLLSCSTSGYENDGIYDELIKRSTRFLLGESKETKLAPILYMIDDIEKWDDIEELKKSNPNLNVSVSEDYLKEEIAIAQSSLSKKAEFITKYCNLKQNSSQAFLEAKVVEDAFSEETLNLEDFRNCYCVGGIDLSQTTDLTSCNVVIEKNGELYVFSKFFMPAEKIQEATERDGLPYWIYIEKGFLQPSGENFVDYHDCFNWYAELVEKYEILPLQVGYDRYSAQYLVQDMEAFGFHMDDVYQGDNLWPTIQETEGLLKDKKIHCGNNDLLKVHFLDTAVKMSIERGRGRIVKLSANAHIDGMAALLDAMCVRQKWYNEIGQQLKNEE